MIRLRSESRDLALHVPLNHAPSRAARPKATRKFRQQRRGRESTRFPDARLRPMPRREAGLADY